MTDNSCKSLAGVRTYSEFLTKHNVNFVNCVNYRKPIPGDLIGRGFIGPYVPQHLKKVTPSDFTSFDPLSHEEAMRPIFAWTSVATCPKTGNKINANAVGNDGPVPPQPVVPPKKLYFCLQSGTVYTSIDSLPLDRHNEKDYMVFEPGVIQTMKLVPKTKIKK